MRFALTGFKLSFNTSYNVEAPGLTLYNWGGVGKGEAYDMKCQVYWIYMYCFVFRLIGLYCTWGNGVLGGGGGGGLIHVSGNLLFMYGSLQSKMEYIKKLSNFYFQWTKTLDQNNYLFI